VSLSSFLKITHTKKIKNLHDYVYPRFFFFNPRFKCTINAGEFGIGGIYVATLLMCEPKYKIRSSFWRIQVEIIELYVTVE
jgi:hypothetical protein